MSLETRTLASSIISTPTGDPKQELLQQRFGHLIPPSARHLALNYFREWTHDEIVTALARLAVFDEPLQIVNRDRDASCVDWLLPTYELVRRSANDQLALCVNREGQFLLKETNYVALSHVWSEGLYADSQGRGLPRYVIEEIFDRLAGHTIEWIWLDSLVIPNVDPTRPELSTIKTALINMMPEIYGEARWVIFLDALVMEVDSADSLDIAVAIFCGRWRTRVWTFQEAALSTDTGFLTRNGLVGLKDIVRDLGRRCNFDTTSNLFETGPIESDDARRCRGFFMALHTLAFVYENGLDIPSVVLQSYARESTTDLDYARAFAPTLRVSWEESWTREQGMDIIYRTQREASARLILMHGAPRLVHGVAWAPSYLTGLRGEKLENNIIWNNEGVVRHFYAYYILSMYTMPTIPFLTLEITIPLGDDLSPAQIICAFHPSENPAAIDAFENARPGTHYLLTDRPLETPVGNFPFIGLLATYLPDVKSSQPHVAPYYTVEIKSTNPSPLPARSPVSMLVTHRSPLLPVEMASPPEQLWYYHSLPYFHAPGFTPLHHAARRHSYNTLEELLRSAATAASTTLTDIRRILNATDDPDHLNTPLHVATSRNRPQNITLLLDAGADPDPVNSTKKTPLMIAAAAGYKETVEALLRGGAQVDKVTSSAAVLEAIVGRKTEVLRCLLEAVMKREAGFVAEDGLSHGRGMENTLEVKDVWGWGVRDWAQWVDDEGIRTALEEVGLDRNATGALGDAESAK
jgi:hypothetical protein